MRFTKRLIRSGLAALLLVCIAFLNIGNGVLTSAAGESEEWTCPSCGQTGNTRNFCRTCGNQKPEESTSTPSPAPASTVEIDNDQTYETALKLAGNDLSNLSRLQDAMTMLKQTGAYSYSKSYLMYFQAICESQQDNDLNAARLRLVNCSKQSGFLSDLQNRKYPSCEELIKYVDARILESKGLINDAYAAFVDLEVLDSPDRAFNIGLLVEEEPTAPPTPTPTPTPAFTPTPPQKSTPTPTPNGTLIESGVAGKDSEWRMYSNGVLEIAGTGKMYDCEWNVREQNAEQPWEKYRDAVDAVVIDDGISYIGECSFRQCSRITTVHIPNSVTGIGWCAFYGCKNLQEFAVAPDNLAYCSVDGVLFNKAMTELLIYPADKRGDTYTVPDGVTEIGSFSYCDHLKVINMPDSVIEFSGSIFTDCDGIEEIILPLNIITIPSYLFWGCDRLKKITIQENVKYISDDAFFICDALTDIYYTGTADQWKKITIGDDNKELNKAKLHFLGKAE